MNTFLAKGSALGRETVNSCQPIRTRSPLTTGWPSSPAEASLNTDRFCSDKEKSSRVSSLNRWCVRIPNSANTNSSHHHKGRSPCDQWRCGGPGEDGGVSFMHFPARGVCEPRFGVDH